MLDEPEWLVFQKSGAGLTVKKRSIDTSKPQDVTIQGDAAAFSNPYVRRPAASPGTP